MSKFPFTPHAFKFTHFSTAYDFIRHGLLLLLLFLLLFLHLLSLFRHILLLFVLLLLHHHLLLQLLSLIHFPFIDLTRFTLHCETEITYT